MDSFLLSSPFNQGLERYSGDLGFDQNTVRDSENVIWICDLTATRVAGFAKFGLGCRIGRENSLRASSPWHSGGKAGKGRRACNYVSGI